MRIEPIFLFDLDGTLVDSVYQHVLAWKTALDAEGIELSVWRICSTSTRSEVGGRSFPKGTPPSWPIQHDAG